MVFTFTLTPNGSRWRLPDRLREVRAGGGDRRALGTYYYDLAEQGPGHVWVLVPPGKRTSSDGYKFIRTKVNLAHGIVGEKCYRIASVEGLEGLKFITKIGERTAIKAARKALAKKQTTELKLGKTSKDLGLELVLRKYLEVIVP